MNIALAKVFVLSIYLIYMTNLFSSSSISSATLKTINTIAHVIAVGSISLLFRLIVR